MAQATRLSTTSAELETLMAKLGAALKAAGGPLSPREAELPVLGLAPVVPVLQMTAPSSTDGQACCMLASACMQPEISSGMRSTDCMQPTERTARIEQAKTLAALYSRAKRAEIPQVDRIMPLAGGDVKWVKHADSQ
mmetsp:Transcript_102176/g.218790  ORF Transcript_102176/g.218790 Transcript_102176/m.218790 type:complete len:137 (+) Transcript_102176:82-492(+)